MGFLETVFGAVSLIAAFGLGFNAFQGNTVAGAAQDSLGIDRIWSGLLLAVLTGFVVYGGIKRIARVADVVVPIMAIGYIGMALIISDPMMGILALVNLLAITMLFPVGLRILNDYRGQLRAGVEHPVLDPEKFADLDIDDTIWRREGGTGS